MEDITRFRNKAIKGLRQNYKGLLKVSMEELEGAQERFISKGRR